MLAFTRQDLLELASLRGHGLVSLYLPTARTGPETEHGRIHLKNLLNDAEVSLVSLGMRGTEAHELLSPARALLDDHEFWQHQSEGLALFVTPHAMHQFAIAAPTAEFLFVGSHLHLRPLISMLAGDGSFHLLALSQQRVRLFQGTRDTMREVTLQDAPESMLAAVGHDVEQRSRSFRTMASGSGGRHQPAVGQGHATPRDEAKAELGVFLRQVDRAVTAQVGASGTPLVLAGVEYVTAMYRIGSAYPTIVDEVIAGSPDALSASQLHAAAWPIVAGTFAAERHGAIARFHEATGAGLATDELREIVRAAHAGRVADLLLAEGQHRWGQFDPEAQRVVLHAERQPDDEDLLDTAATAALRTGADVHTMPMALMPGGRSVAAILRF